MFPTIRESAAVVSLACAPAYAVFLRTACEPSWYAVHKGLIIPSGCIMAPPSVGPTDGAMRFAPYSQIVTEN
jgi:hypothetical protein